MLKGMLMGSSFAEKNNFHVVKLSLLVYMYMYYTIIIFH